MSFWPDQNRKWLCYATAHVFFEDLFDIQNALLKTSSSMISQGRPLEPNTYFIRKAFCILTSRIPASKELNKLNVFLKKACLNGRMYDSFENYVSRMIF